MTTPNELYAMDPEKIDNNIAILIGCHYNHIEESGLKYGSLDFALVTDNVNERVKIKYLKDFNFDYRRFWRLASVWYDGIPVMIIRNAGREGDDHYSRFITNKEAFHEMCLHIRSLVPLQVEEIIDVIDSEKDIKDLLEFYGNHLNGYFDRNRY